MNRIAVLFQHLGPYHRARLRAAGKNGKVIAVEVSDSSCDYAWEPVRGAEQFQRVTLFRGQDATSPPRRELVRRLWLALDSLRPQAVAVPGWSDPAALAALHWCVVNCKPAIMMAESSRHDRSRNFSSEIIKSCIVRLCATALVGGTAHASYLARLGMEPERIYTGYDVVDNHHFAMEAAATRRDSAATRAHRGLPEHYFLACSRFLEKKNLARLLLAYADYRKLHQVNGWKLVLLGDGPLKPQILKLRAELGLVDEVQLPGFKQYPDLPAYYALAGAFVHASTVEQWGLVVNEAMAAGLPVIVANRCGCASDLVHDGRNGFTFDPYSVSQLTQLFARVAADSCPRSEMGHASQAIITRWCLETFAENLWKATATALASPRRQAKPLDRLLVRTLVKMR